MSAKKIINFPTNCVHLNEETKQSPRAVGAVIIDRRDFHHWMKKGVPSKLYDVDLSEKFSIMQERLGRIKIAFEMGGNPEVVTQSARIAVLAEQLGLPRTSKLAADIGEAQMSGQYSKALRLIGKLEAIVVALGEDFRREVR